MEKIIKEILEKTEVDHKIKLRKENELALSQAENAVKDERSGVTSKQKMLSAAFQTDARHRYDLEKAKIRLEVRTKQLQDMDNSIQQLRRQLENGVCSVWKHREQFCSATAELSDQCSVSAMLSISTAANILAESTSVEVQIPANDESDLTMTVVKETTDNSIEQLRTINLRKEILLAERDRLRMEPEQGEEFVSKCLRGIRPTSRCVRTTAKESIDEPIKFSTSKAAKKISLIKNEIAVDIPWYQPYIVSGSLIVFLVYFCILRAENDIDKEFDKNLYERLEGLEKQQLLQSYRYNKENGLSVADIERRLKEIDAS